MIGAIVQGRWVSTTAVRLRITPIKLVTLTQRHSPATQQGRLVARLSGDQAGTRRASRPLEGGRATRSTGSKQRAVNC